MRPWKHNYRLNGQGEGGSAGNAESAFLAKMRYFQHGCKKRGQGKAKNGKQLARVVLGGT